MEIDEIYIKQLDEKVSALEQKMSRPDISSNPQLMKNCISEYTHQKKLFQLLRNYLALIKINLKVNTFWMIQIVIQN